MAFPITVRAGLLFPEETLQADWFAVNTLMYGALAIAKILPKLHPGEWLRTRNQRSETRSICPAAPVVDARDFRAAPSGRSRGSG